MQKSKKFYLSLWIPYYIIFFALLYANFQQIVSIINDIDPVLENFKIFFAISTFTLWLLTPLVTVMFPHEEDSLIVSPIVIYVMIAMGYLVGELLPNETFIFGKISFIFLLVSFRHLNEIVNTITVFIAKKR